MMKATIIVNIKNMIAMRTIKPIMIEWLEDSEFESLEVVEFDVVFDSIGGWVLFEGLLSG